MVRRSIIDRRKSLGRRIVRDRRRDPEDVQAERRGGKDRRSGVHRRSGEERRQAGVAAD